MELVDTSEVGKFGTIRLLKQREPTSVVAAYPVDDDEVSFGRDPNCSVRLYYPEVSPLHCKIIFEERKAILQVFGTNGVLVDGCTVYPAKPAPVGFAPTTVSVPLPNNSVFEIHKKRFVFNYPPKALRPQLFTPAAAHRKSVRMSLVQCAQVFSPAPSPNARENLRVLQSPLKLGSSDAPVTLVNSDRPRVFEEEQDLVILEDTEEKANHPPSPTPIRTQAAPRTPRRSAPSLHRAVLIRSAQRNAYIREESERQKTFTQPQFTQINLDEDADGEAEEEDEVMNSILDVPEEAEHHATTDAMDLEQPSNDDAVAADEDGFEDVSHHFHMHLAESEISHIDIYGGRRRRKHTSRRSKGAFKSCSGRTNSSPRFIHDSTASTPCPKTDARDYGTTSDWATTTTPGICFLSRLLGVTNYYCQRREGGS